MHIRHSVLQCVAVCCSVLQFNVTAQTTVESYHTHAQFISHTHMHHSYHTHASTDVTHMHHPCHTHAYFMSHTCIILGTPMHNPRYTHASCMSHISIIRITQNRGRANDLHTHTRTHTHTRKHTFLRLHCDAVK